RQVARRQGETAYGGGKGGTDELSALSAATAASARRGRVLRLDRVRGEPRRNGAQVLPDRPPAAPRGVRRVRVRRNQAGRRAMKWEQIASHWAEYKLNARRRWSRLSPEDLDAIAGDRARLLARIAELY